MGGAIGLVILLPILDRA